MSWTPLFSELVTSSIWQTPDHVRIVFITMLAIKDRYGEVMASVPGLANIARVTIEQCADAIKILESPDEFSRTTDKEGRRIEPVEGGWKIINYEVYRDKVAKMQKRERDRKAQARHREKTKTNGMVYKTMEEKVEEGNYD